MAMLRMHHKQHAGTARVPAHPRSTYGKTPKKPEADDLPGKMRGGAKGRKKRLAGMMI